ncbi:MAG: ABC transporter permease [Desulfobacterales bacterium]|nr:permease-like cell division protein FtsX [Deltaproteobacteria bacterium]MBT8374677.1 permease-like cell division protein FtsX [Deltaproteobacteria bacterium]NNL41437.1 ABC transporter permease [Desulfobacterales bacterium]
MRLFYKRAIQDIRKNRFLNAVTIVTIALSILIVSVFALFFINTNDLINHWKKGIRIMVYLKANTVEAKIPDIKKKFEAMYGVAEAVFIPREEALKRLKKQIKRQISLLEDLKENPLPDAFEVRMIPSSQSWEKVENLSGKIKSLPYVDDVEYGKKWLGGFTNIVNLFRLTGYGVGGLFFMAAVFIVANTIRLVLYSRREEIEIMRLIGASDRFIKTPFYIQGLIQGTLGGIIGLGILFVTFIIIASNIEHGFLPGSFQIRFLPLVAFFSIVISSMLVGWLGCYLSLKQFLKI